VQLDAAHAHGETSDEPGGDPLGHLGSRQPAPAPGASRRVFCRNQSLRESPQQGPAAGERGQRGRPAQGRIAARPRKPLGKVRPPRTAFITAGRAPVTPASPQPLTPSGLLAAGTGWKPTSIGGTPSARGRL
jgi:hypothetical protein